MVIGFYFYRLIQRMNNLEDDLYSKQEMEYVGNEENQDINMQ